MEEGSVGLSRSAQRRLAVLLQVCRTTPEVITQGLERLPRREAMILCRYFGWENVAPQTLQVIATAYGLSRTRIEQLCLDGIAKLIAVYKHCHPERWSQ